MSRNQRHTFIAEIGAFHTAGSVLIRDLKISGP